MSQKLITLLVVAGLTGSAALAVAQPGKPSGPAGQAQSAESSEATVKKVDPANGKVTLAHGPLKNLGMPAMTMVFKVKDTAMLGKLKEGDKIAFVAEIAGSEYLATKIQKAK